MMCQAIFTYLVFKDFGPSFPKPVAVRVCPPSSCTLLLGRVLDCLLSPPRFQAIPPTVCAGVAALWQPVVYWGQKWFCVSC